MYFLPSPSFPPSSIPSPLSSFPFPLSIYLLGACSPAPCIKLDGLGGAVRSRSGSGLQFPLAAHTSASDSAFAWHCTINDLTFYLLSYLYEQLSRSIFVSWWKWNWWFFRRGCCCVDYKNDPYSEGDPCSTICCRGDLMKSPRPSGCYDAKVCWLICVLQVQALGIPYCQSTWMSGRGHLWG